MTQTDYTTRVLRADQGYMLTQADPDTPILRRSITDTVYLAATDSPERWHEITVAEAEVLLAERAAAQAAQDAADEAEMATMAIARD